MSRTQRLPPFRSLAAGLFLLLLPALPGLVRATTGASGESVGQPFSDAVDVRVVEVDAVVTGDHGERIEGLDAGKFRLLIDGREVPVEFFEEVRSTDMAATYDGEIPGGEPAAEAQRDYLVFIDDTFTDRGRRQRLLNQLIEQVGTLGPGERMAVVRYEGRGLEVISDWTESKDQLVRALQSARDRTPSELIRRAETSGAANPVFNARLRAEQIADVMDAMGATLRSLANVEGRKLFLPVSAGWPYDPTLELGDTFRGVHAGESDFPETHRFADVGHLPLLSDISSYLNDRLLLPVTDTANLLGYTIYPLHVGAGGNLRWSSMWSIARQTGGAMAAEEGFNRRPLDTVRRDTSSYYVLGFAPDWEWNDRRHRVEVEVDVPGAEVRNRRSFSDLSRDTQRALRVEQALLVDLGPGDLAISLGSPRPVKRSVVEVPVELEIPMDWVTRTESQGEWQSALELRVASLDARGERSDMPVIPVTLSGDTARLGTPNGDGQAVYTTRVRLRNAPQRLVLALTDTRSGEARLAAVDFVP